TVRVWCTLTGLEVMRGLHGGNLQYKGSAPQPYHDGLVGTWIYEGPMDAIFSPDNKYLATISGSDGTCRIWDVDTQNEWRRFQNCSGSRVEYAAGSSILVAGTFRNGIILFDIQSSDTLETIMPGTQIMALRLRKKTLKSANNK
ncbi:MAG TPA: hypothetical protein V6C72_17230, partial [Chroococcales cyanobacterium]